MGAKKVHVFKSWFSPTVLLNECQLSTKRSVGANPNRRGSSRNRARRFGRVERLEDRRLLAAYIVNSLADSGAGTLREAIVSSNANGAAETDTISFAIAGTINLTSSLPALQTPTTIDGTTAPTYAGTPVVEINFGNVALGQVGLYVGGGNSTLRGLALNRSGGVGVWIASHGNAIAQNYIGTDLSGTIDRGNAFQGIFLNGNNNSVQGNLISGNDANGIWINGGGGNARSNAIRGNLIGTNAIGMGALGNEINGIFMSDGAQDNTLSGNIISSNGNNGMWLLGAGVTNNRIQGNRIGTDLFGQLGRGNAAAGVRISDGANGNWVGTDGDGTSDTTEGNLISGNGQAGIDISGAGTSNNVVAGNRIGTNEAGTSAIPNLQGVWLAASSTFNRIGTNQDGISDEFERNVISGNSQFGIALRDSQTSNNIIAGNYIGTTLSGQASLPNVSDGISSSSNANSFRSNIIAGNGGSGLVLFANDSIATGNVIGLAANGVTDLGHPAVGIYITGARNRIGGSSPVDMNIVSASSFSGIEIIGNDAFENTVQGNRIGTDITGTLARGNGKLTRFLDTTGGILVVDGAQRNIIGTNADGVADASEGNLISGNVTHGVHIWNTANNTVAGNRIGTNASGTSQLGNGGSGVRVRQASNNRIGSSVSAARNVISGNTLEGVEISGLQASLNQVQGNYIGVDLTGSSAIGNRSYGIAIRAGASRNIIGTNSDGVGDATERNVISGNTQFGVGIHDTDTNNNVVAGNRIGTDHSGQQAIGNGNHGVWVAVGARLNRIGTDGNGVSDIEERNVISGGLSEGVTFSNAHDNTVAGNFIGLNATGTAALPNVSSGIAINNGSLRNVIGTNGDGIGDLAEGNTVSGNGGAGVIVQGSSQNVIAGNKIGTNPSGSAAIGNGGAGVFLRTASANNRIGTNGDASSDALETNVISGNGSHGVFLDGVGTTGNQVMGNVIGADGSGQLAVPNLLGGVHLAGGASQNVIGTALHGNRIAFNVQAGVGVIHDSRRNTIRGNSISANGAIGIDLLLNGRTLNDSNDVDAGPNDLLNFPVLQSVIPGSTTRAVGTYQGLASSTFTLDFYANAQLDSTEYGEGARWLGAINITTDALGNAAFDALLAAATISSDLITATATDSLGNTSEFSRGLGLDVQMPSSRVNPLPRVASSLSFPVSVTGDDPSESGRPASGVAFYDLYVSVNGLPFSLWTTVTAAASSAVYSAVSGNTYGFRSIASDWAGNVETKAVQTEASITVPDLSPPNTQVVSIDSSNPTFQMQIQGTDVGGSGLREFILFASIDNGSFIEVSRLAAGQPNASGAYFVTTTYQAIADGAEHTYRFYTVGVDQRGNIEPPPAAGHDVFVRATFAAPSALAITNFDVQRGASQRSFIRHLDVSLNTSTGVSSLLSSVQDGDANNDRLRLRRFETDGSSGGELISLNGRLNFRAVDQVLAFDFGAAGIGGSPSTTVGNGYYSLEFDFDANGSFEAVRNFYRLLGDTNGDRIVDAVDHTRVSQAIGSVGSNLNQDINGDGLVNLNDVLATRRGLGRSIGPNLRLDD